VIEIAYILANSIHTSPVIDEKVPAAVLLRLYHVPRVSDGHQFLSNRTAGA
jgi:hypothetical protein